MSDTQPGSNELGTTILRDRLIQVRVDRETKLMIEAAAGRSKVSVSEFMRRAAMGEIVRLGIKEARETPPPF